MLLSLHSKAAGHQRKKKIPKLKRLKIIKKQNEEVRPLFLGQTLGTHSWLWSKRNPVCLWEGLGSLASALCRHHLPALLRDHCTVWGYLCICLFLWLDKSLKTFQLFCEPVFHYSAFTNKTDKNISDVRLREDSNWQIWSSEES